MNHGQAVDRDLLLAGQQRLDALGPRLTGSPAHHEVVEEVANELTELGLDVRRDSHTFERWDLRRHLTDFASNCRRDRSEFRPHSPTPD